MMDLDKNRPVFNMNINVSKLKLDALNLTEKQENSELSFSAQADFQGNLDDSQGSIRLNDIHFKKNDDAIFFQELALFLNGEYPERKITLHSDLINGELAGLIHPATLIPDMKRAFAQYFSVFAPTVEQPKIQRTNYKKTDANANMNKENHFTGSFIIGNTEDISRIFNLPITIVNPARINASFNGKTGKFKLETDFPNLIFLKNNMLATRLLIENPESTLHVSLNSRRVNAAKNTFADIAVQADAQHNSIAATIAFDNNDTVACTNGRLNAVASFCREWDNTLRTTLELQPSTLELSNKVFFIRQSFMEFVDNRILVERFALESEDEHIRLNGAYSTTATDTLYMDLSNANLALIEMLTNNPILGFGGLATGKFTIVGKPTGIPILFTNLFVKDFSYNDAVLGDLNMFSQWDEDKQGILLDGEIMQPDCLPTTVYGHIFPTKDSLNLLFDANHLNLKLINPFVANVLTNFSGWGYGKVRLAGGFKTIAFEGNPYLKDVKFGVDFLNTQYAFSDTLFMGRNAFRLRNATVSDKNKNVAMLSATLRHNYFKDIAYDVTIRTNNLLAFNATQKKNPVFFGTVYGAGTVRLSGDTQKIDINVNMQSERNSMLTLSFFDNISASSLDFVTFVKKKIDLVTSKATLVNEPLASKFETNLTLQIEATPDATIQMIMDPKTNDLMRGKGAGNLRLVYNNRTGNLELFGTYTLQQGAYNFSWEELIKKNFSIQNGSTISFNGDPYSALLNVKAIYSLDADISSLESSLSEESGRQTVPVDVIINITGNLKHPEIKPSIDLPNSGDDVRRKVNSLIYTQSDITKQAFYLLLTGQFDSQGQVSISNSGSSQLASVVSSTLSSQLNTVLSQISNRFSIGVNFQSQTNLAGQQDFRGGLKIFMPVFNDRVILKGSLGYQENLYQSNNFIGDFDIEYKLTKSGDIRLKGYSHFNDNSLYYGRSGLTTQGLGIMYTKDFTALRELTQRPTGRLQNLPVFRRSAAADSLNVSSDSFDLTHPPADKNATK
jgi:hypothetical protein